MPITSIDPGVALLVIDLQAGFANAPSIEPVTEVAARVRELADEFRALHLPVVLVTVDGERRAAPTRASQPNEPSPTASPSHSPSSASTPTTTRSPNRGGAPSQARDSSTVFDSRASRSSSSPG
jgi:nicotinamidase-related amidase